jgi:hypothetical protein
MAQKDLKAALTASLQAEHRAVQARLAKADAYFQTQEAHTGRVNSPSPAPEKVIRDGFTMPAGDYALLAQLQATCLEAGLAVNKSEVLRAGLHALKAMSPADLRQVLSTLEKVKAGRPAKRSP